MTKESSSCVVTVGFFDGVHLGHQLLLRELIRLAKSMQAQAVVVTFWPHPREVTQDHFQMELINTPQEKRILLEQCGVDQIIEIPFNHAISKLSALQFVEQHIASHITVKHLLLGHDHRFGCEQSHQLSRYKSIGDQLGFSVSQCAAYSCEGVIISSSAIRKCLHQGMLETAIRYLGYNYRLSGKVVYGKQMGRKMGFPTANIAPECHKVIPMQGVYAVRILVEEMWHDAMLNIGYRPTIDSLENLRLSIEVHIFNFTKELYDQEVSVLFIARLRNEIKFNSLEELQQQLRVDQHDSLAILGNI